MLPDEILPKKNMTVIICFISTWQYHRENPEVLQEGIFISYSKVFRVCNFSSKKIISFRKKKVKQIDK